MLAMLPSQSYKRKGTPMSNKVEPRSVPLELCPLCAGDGKIENTRAVKLQELIIVFNSLSPTDQDEVIDYAKYLRYRKR